MRKGKWHYKLAVLLSLAIIISLVSLGCSGANSTKSENEDQAATGRVATESFPRLVTDVTGREITIAAKPMRIISVVPSVTEILFDLGLAEQIVGVTTNCDYPEQAAGKEKVGDWTINVEKLVSLEPDLVIGMKSTSGVLLDEIAKLGINTLQIEAQNFARIYEVLEMVGWATGTEERANQMIEDMQARIKAVQEKVVHIPAADKVKVFMEVGWEPLYTVGEGSLQHEIIGIAGGINVVQEAKPWVEFSNEKLIELDPDLIIMVTHPFYTADQAKTRTGWQELSAVKKNRLVDTIETNTLVRPTYRAVLGLEEVAKVLYPDLFKSSIMKKKGE